MATPDLPLALADVETPALVVDLDALEANISTMRRGIIGRGKQWRPHAKGHKSPVIAQRQLAAGAIGVTVAKTSEAEVFAEAGVRDILIANCVVGESKMQRVARLCRIAAPIVCCDHFVQAEALSRSCASAGVCCRVLIDVNLGLNRTGVRPGSDARDLARAISRLDGVELAGVMGYEGHLLTISDPGEKRDRIHAALGMLRDVRDQLLTDGLPCPIVSAGGTGSFEIAAECAGVTEIQAGGGIFGDPFYTEACSVAGLTPALALLASVVSRPKLERAVLDCGRKSLSPEVHPSHVISRIEGLPLPDAEITMYSAEHLTLELGPRSQELHIGDKVLLRPGYGDLTTVLHDRFYGVRGGVVEEVIPIAARGALQ
jgi:D-serine deaminase-like pyridoxal phosphate-dependent protein